LRLGVEFPVARVFEEASMQNDQNDAGKRN
jgi:hypothetical protein